MAGYVTTAPVLDPTDLLDRATPNVLTELVRANPGSCHAYGHGKPALEDGLHAVGAEPGANVLLPAYVPDGVVEPIRETGATPRFYPITDALEPQPGAVEAAIDDDTVAVLAVNYFGFPQPWDGLADVAHAHDAVVVDDNAHAPLSRDGTTLLGTRGALGFTSFRKLFPVPNGAELFVNDEAARREFSGALAGRTDDVTASDWRFLLGAARRYVRHRLPRARRVPGVAGRSDDAGDDGPTHDGPDRDPRAIFERSKQPMSRLTMAILQRLDPRVVREGRRRVYRTWTDRLRGSAATLPFERLPGGVCPQVCPVVVDDAESAAASLRTHGFDVGTWPPLPSEVAGNDAFATSNYLADHLLRLPVHRATSERAVGRVDL